MKSKEWKYLQTPQFSLSNAADEFAKVSIELIVRHGAITEGYIFNHDPGRTNLELEGTLIGQKLHEIQSWESTLRSSLDSMESKAGRYLVDWMDNLLPRT